MKTFKRIVSVLLVLVTLIQVCAGCSSKKTDDKIYFTKGEFFAYFVYDNGMTSQKYTSEDINNSLDGSVEADILVEWGYITKKQAKKLNTPVTKEIVVTVCAKNALYLNEGNTSEIKDADLLDDPQLIADAYASGFFELKNGYFNGAQKLAFLEIEEIMNKAKEHSANFHFEENTEKTELAEDVVEYDCSDTGDGGISFNFEVEAVEEDEDDEGTSEYTYASAQKNESTYFFKHASHTGTGGQKITKLDNKPVTNFAPGVNTNFSFNSFSAVIPQITFEQTMKNPKVGDVVVFKNCRDYFLMNHQYLFNSTEIAGILKSVTKHGAAYNCLFEKPAFEPAVNAKNVTESNRSGIQVSEFETLETNVAGWKLEFDPNGGQIKVTATKKATQKGVGTTHNDKTAEKSVNAKIEFTVGDFQVDTSNLKSFANKKGEGFIKVTCDTKTTFSLSSGFRYTPYNNGNGKFPSNFSRSRWTDSGAPGAKEIKIARFPLTVAGVIGIDIYLYLNIGIDGSITLSTSIEDGGMMIKANNGNISITKLGTKRDTLEAKVNVHARLAARVSIKIFGFINVIEYDLGFDFELLATLNMFYEDEIQQKGVCADPDVIEEYKQNVPEFGYCFGVVFTISISGHMNDSGVKWIMDLMGAGGALNFDVQLFEASIHFEETGKVDECTRGVEVESDVETSEEGEIELDSYKVNMTNGTCQQVELKALPLDSKKFTNSKYSVSVKTNNKKVVKATYNKSNKTITLESVGEGSTEIVITARKGHLWWKDKVDQKISVTVNNETTADNVSVESIVIIPYIPEGVYLT